MKEQNQENTLRNIEIQRMIWLTGMKTVGLSLSIHMDQQSMLENQVMLVYQVVRLVFQLIDPWERFILAQDVENYLFWVQCNFSAMNFMKKRTIKKFKIPFLTGYLKMKAN